LLNFSPARRGKQIHHGHDRFGHVVPGRFPAVARGCLGLGPRQQLREGRLFGVSRQRRHQQDADCQKAATKVARHFNVSRARYFFTALAARGARLERFDAERKTVLGTPQMAI
jgi:hypothetical protein